MRIVLTAAIALLSLIAQTADAQSNRAQILAQGLQAADDLDWANADRAMRALSEQPARDVIQWTKLRAREGSFAEYLDFLTRNADWPGMPLLAARGEASIPENARPADVLTYFANHAPRTGEGSLRLAAAERARGNTSKANALIVKAWREFTLDSETEAKFLNSYGSLLADHHTARLDNLLWQGLTGPARRMFPLVSNDWRLSSEARIKLRNDQNGVDAAIEAVPTGFQNGAGLAYERYLWRLKKRRTAGAIELMLERSTSAAALGRPAAWGSRRRSFARDLMRDGKNQTAYRLAANHFIGQGPGEEPRGNDYSDLEWLAGYIALRKLNDPRTALRHFQNHRASVASPISLGRAGYWEGRAYEAMGDSANARAAYMRAAQHQTSFYGQLAVERAGLPTDPALVGAEVFPDWRQAPFLGTSVMRAGLFLQEAGNRTLANRFFGHLSERLDRTQRGQLGDLALALNEPYIALRLAKFAAGEGQLLHRAYHPVTDLARSPLQVHPALALAIARRESEFNPAVVSPAGALGLMQLMPRTGEAMARDLGVSGFRPARLLSEPNLNARLGSEYLSQQISDFGNNIALVASAYNAGPSRANNWIERFGDPRGGRVDIVDWVEHVPFRETRNYIMRVTESMLVYEMMLAGKPIPLEPTKRLTQR